MPFPELNLKQAWRIPSAVSLANPNGTAPGWFVTRPDGRVIVALPGPPREMRPMWSDEVVPRLDALGLGAEVASRTYRLAGIGESQVAELLGEPMLRATNPIVATYARVEAVDVRISAVADDVAGGRRPRGDAPPRSSSSGSGRMSGRPARRPGARPSAGACEELGWTLAVVEIGTGGSIDGLFGDAPWVRFDESIAPDAPAAQAHGPGDARPRTTSRPRMTRMTTRSPTTSSCSRGAPASSAAPRSDWPFAHGRGPGIRRSRSPSRRPTARSVSDGSSS